MNNVQFMKTTLLAMQHEKDNLRKIIARLLQVSTLMERLQRISVDLESVLKQLKWQESPTEHPASQSKLTVQEFTSVVRQRWSDIVKSLKRKTGTDTWNTEVMTLQKTKSTAYDSAFLRQPKTQPSSSSSQRAS